MFLDHVLLNSKNSLLLYDTEKQSVLATFDDSFSTPLKFISDGTYFVAGAYIPPSDGLRHAFNFFGCKNSKINCIGVLGNQQDKIPYSVCWSDDFCYLFLANCSGQIRVLSPLPLPGKGEDPFRAALPVPQEYYDDTSESSSDVNLRRGYYDDTSESSSDGFNNCFSDVPSDTSSSEHVVEDLEYFDFREDPEFWR